MVTTMFKHSDRGAYIEQRKSMLCQAILLISFQLALSSLGLAQDKSAGFAGKWLRDDVVNQDGSHLPRVIWQITFDDKTMTLVELSEKGEVSRTVTYNLDGTDSLSDLRNHSGKQVTHRLKRRGKEEMELTDILPGSGNSGVSGMIASETWRLTNKGNTLKTVRKVRLADENSPIKIADALIAFQKVQPSTAH